MYMAAEINKAHREDLVWQKNKHVGRDSGVWIDGEYYNSEYVNVATGWVIRKGVKMTGQDWKIWDANGELMGWEGTLQYAKFGAELYLTTGKKMAGL